jgi:CRISPR-associated protein Csb2
VAYLVVGVRFHEGRYHGRPQGGALWPPAPARLFQALVAGAARGETLAGEDKSAFVWLECLEPPVIAAPPMRAGRGFRNFVPNNDLDAVGGDPSRVAEIRTPKPVRPILFDAETPLLYFWTFDDPEAQAKAKRVCALAERLYQLGRGVDMAWAWGEVLGADEAEARLVKHGGVVHRPSKSGGGRTLAVPVNGSLDSLIARYQEMRRRFHTLYAPKPTKKEPGRRVAEGQIFSQPRRPRFGQTAYGSPPMRLLFDLRRRGTGDAPADFAPWPLARVTELVTTIRDRAVAHLGRHLPEKRALIERVLVGREATEADKAARVHIVPLPSVGHTHADHAIRRILVEVPPDCPLNSGDLEWGLSGLDLGADYQTGEVIDENAPILTARADRSMVRRYGIEPIDPVRVWRTVTPAALPQSGARRRIDPARAHDPAEQKRASERTAEQERAAGAVIQALRHAGLRSVVTAVRVQREPFSGKGERAEPFAPGTRFAKERLWHVEITFAEPVAGPLIIGDGRYLGLGLMEPVTGAHRDLFLFSAPPGVRLALPDGTDLLRAVRRALMALSRQSDGTVPLLFSGHERGGAPSRTRRHRHVFLAAADLGDNNRITDVIVGAPWVCDRSVRPGRGERALFDRVVGSLATVRAGPLGVIPVQISPVDPRLIGPAHCWESRIEYRPTRHAKRDEEPTAALLRDVIAECERRGFPLPEPELLKITIGPKGGVAARVRLRFAVAVAGPIMLGRDSHQGGGLFLTSH